MSRLIAVTGGTGFIGDSLCRALLGRGYRVRILARSPRKAAVLQHSGAEIVEGELSDALAMARLVKDSYAVIHCAGTVRGRKPEDFYPANVSGVEQLIAALSNNNQGSRLLLFSSLAAREPSLSHYSASKYMGERVALDSEPSVSLSILRPPPVYGAGDKELLPLFRFMAHGLAPVPGSPSDRVSLLYIDDLVAAVASWLQIDRVPRQVFTLADPVAGGYSWAEIAAIAGQVFQRSVRPIALPSLLLNSVAAINQLASGLLGYAPMLTPAKLKELRHHNWCCDSHDFSVATGWQPQVGFAQGLALTVGAANCHAKLL